MADPLADLSLADLLADLEPDPDLLATARRRSELPSPELARWLRQQARLSQGEVANYCGVQRTAVARWEAGIRRPQQGPHLDRYAELLRVLREALHR